VGLHIEGLAIPAAKYHYTFSVCASHTPIANRQEEKLFNIK